MGKAVITDMRSTDSKTQFGLIHEIHSYRDRISGLYDGDRYAISADYDEIEGLWKQAGNIVQWRGRNT